MCHSDWISEKLNGQELGKEDAGKKEEEEVASRM